MTETMEGGADALVRERPTTDREGPRSVVVMIDGEPTFFCPGCQLPHLINVYQPNEMTDAAWSWNGSHDAPTFEPSINYPGQCHSFVRDGKIQFLPDCDHALAGKTVALEPVPDWLAD